jgi:hypothetical protein
MNNEFGGIPFSIMNKSGDEIFHSEFIKNHAFNGWFREPTSTNDLKCVGFNSLLAIYSSLISSFEIILLTRP